MDNQAAYLREIYKSYPHLEAKTARVTEAGEYNDVLIIDERLIFRFPRSPEGIDRLRVEIAILNAIQGDVSLPVPHPTFVSADMQTVGAVFIGYEMLPGAPLRNHLDALKANVAYPQVASQLALFLRELHSFPAKAVGLELPVYVHDRLEALPGLYHNVREYLYPHMRPEARDFVADQFDRFLNRPASLDYEPVLRHGDLGPGNVLIGPETQAVSGVIDFGSAGLDDPAVDLGFVCFWWETILDESFLERAESGYPGIESLLSRIEFYKTAIALQLALGGLQNDNRDTFEGGLAQYR